MDHAGHDHMGHDHHDHSMHNHISHDHQGHNMSDMIASTTAPAVGDHSHHMMGMAMDHMMKMYFHFGYTDETVLFEFWKIASFGGLLGSMFGIFIMAALYEGLKYYREYLFWKTYHALQYKSVQVPPNKTPGIEDPVVHVLRGVSHRQPPSMWSSTHCFQTFLHAIQMVLSYMLMLIFMTYNVWLCIAVVLGAATGYFLFGWKKSVIVDVTEHCH